ncbi:hypothetical protein [Rickettsia endosymbiont of Polydrusus tereticollis]|uniref:hypothetical protein n=1 Tax=Rickettsia endosymbiont of Polydrusus tereticollis TaxID=3066251 RepID=UPI003132FD77
MTYSTFLIHATMPQLKGVRQSRKIIVILNLFQDSTTRDVQNLFSMTKDCRAGATYLLAMTR